MKHRESTEPSRRWFQFRLRTLLWFTVVAAAVLTFFRPRPQPGRPLRDGWTIYAALRTEPPRVRGDGSVAFEEESRHGRFLVRDAAGRRRVVGSFDSDVPSGNWRIYHPNGQIALEGACRDGVPIGKWSAWHPTRKLAAEVTFRDSPESRSQIGGQQFKVPRAVSQRHGPARFQDARGQVLAGGYRNDARQGNWIHGVTGQTETFDSGVRHEPDAGRLLGHPVDDWKAFLEAIEADLASADRQRQAAAVQLLPYCGAEGVQLAEDCLESGDEPLQRRICDVLRQIGPAAAAAWNPLQMLAEGEGETAVAALIAQAAIRPDDHAALGRLLARAGQAPAPRQDALILQMSRLGSTAVPALRAAIRHDDRAIQQCTFRVLVSSLRWSPGSGDNQAWRQEAPLRQLLDEVAAHQDVDLAQAAREVRRLYEEGLLLSPTPGLPLRAGIGAY